MWDFDVIEGHNIANQAFTLEQIGKSKVDALNDLILGYSGIEYQAEQDEVNGSQELGSIVFLLTDSMFSRRKIFERAIRLNFKTKCLIEARMASDNARIYSINPQNLSDIEGYEETLYKDEDTEVSICGTSVTVGATSSIIAGLAVWQFMRWYGRYMGKKGYTEEEDSIENELLLSLRGTSTIITKKF